LDTAESSPQKLSQLLAKHNGQTEWTETMVDDDTLHADYIAMAPGGKTPRRMNTDTRERWAVQDGQIRFSIDGQAPFVASKGYLVQVRGTANVRRRPGRHRLRAEAAMAPGESCRRWD